MALGRLVVLGEFGGFFIDVHHPKTNMTMQNPPFEDVFPIEHGDFPMSC